MHIHTKELQNANIFSFLEAINIVDRISVHHNKLEKQKEVNKDILIELVFSLVQ